MTTTRTTQQKFTALLATFVENQGFELIDDRDAGVYRVEHPQRLRVLWEMRYSFQPAYVEAAGTYVPLRDLEGLLDRIERDLTSILSHECPASCDNEEYGRCPRCYAECGEGCLHGPLCEECRRDLADCPDERGRWDAYRIRHRFTPREEWRREAV